MYYIKKKIEISASHYLTLDYESKCTRLHGHNWEITVYCRSRELDHNGMVIDFTEVKRRVKRVLDHQNLNEVLPLVCGPDSLLLQGRGAGERGQRSHVCSR